MGALSEVGAFVRDHSGFATGVTADALGDLTTPPPYGIAAGLPSGKG